jgi:hypothetical protein
VAYKNVLERLILKPTEDDPIGTYLYSGCRQEPLHSDTLHSASSTEVVKHRLPRHISSLLVSLTVNE